MGTPSLRFKKDNGSNYEDWRTSVISEVLEYEQPTNYIVKSNQYNEQYPIPVLTANKSFILGYTDETFNLYQNTPVIIFDDFTTDNKYVDFSFKVKSSALKILKPINNTINIKFIYEAMQLINFELGGHKRHWISEYSHLQIPLPCKEEQEKIAHFFTTLDQKIMLIEQGLNRLLAYKKAQLQQIFSLDSSSRSKLRFKKDNGSNYEDWRTASLSEVAEIKTGGTPSTVVDEYWGGEILWMNSGEVNLRQVYDTQGRITKLGLEKSSTRLIPINSVLMALAGQGKTRGTVAINKVKLCVNQSIGAILPKNNLNYEYIYYNLFFRYQELRSVSSGDGARGGLNLKILNDIIIPLPCLEEQEKIAQYLSAIDQKIQNTQQSLTQAKSFKKMMLQKMMG